MRMTVPIILGAIAVSAIAVPAIGIAPWQPAPTSSAKPAQMQSLSRVDTSAPGAMQWADLRSQAQSSLDSLTARDPVEARQRLGEVVSRWQAQKDELQTYFPAHWPSVDKALARAAQRLNAGKPELLLSKAAVLDLLSAMDAATAAPRSSTIASEIRQTEREQIIAAATKDGKTGGAATPRH